MILHNILILKNKTCKKFLLYIIIGIIVLHTIKTILYNMVQKKQFLYEDIFLASLLIKISYYSSQQFPK